ncbi:hypothetical protein CLOM_g14871 [Closterium sp. NIES-68]|nr:hypothetical protein CLOM_g14871 [Closterium sp. NIES-68]GJP62021.1 hypothetical protein CLOP_g19126 [Closterium sp. NIES-67]
MAELASGYRKVSPEAIPDLIAWLGRCLAVRHDQPNSPLWRTSVLQFADVLNHALLLDSPPCSLDPPSHTPFPSCQSSEDNARGKGEISVLHGGPRGESVGAAELDSRSSCALVMEPDTGFDHQQQQQQQQQQQCVSLSGSTATWEPAVRQRFWRELVGLYEGVVRGMCAGEGMVRGMGTGEWHSKSAQGMPPAQVHEDEVLQEQMVRLLGEKVLRYCQDAPEEATQRLVGLLLDLAERAVGEVQLTGSGAGSAGSTEKDTGSANEPASGSSSISHSPSTSTASNRTAPDRSRSFSTPAVSVSPLRNASGPTPASASALSLGSGAGSGGISGSLSGGQVSGGDGRPEAPLSGLARVGSWLGWGGAGRRGSGEGQGGRGEDVRGTGSVVRGGSDGGGGNMVVGRTTSSGAVAGGAGHRGSDEAGGSGGYTNGIAGGNGSGGSNSSSSTWRETLHPVCFTAVHLLPQICGQPSPTDPATSSAVLVARIATPRFLAFAKRRIQRFTEDCLVRGADSMALARRREVRVILEGLTAISLHPIVATSLSHLLPAMDRRASAAAAPLAPPAPLAASTATLSAPPPSLSHSIAAATAPRSKAASAPAARASAAAASARPAIPPLSGRSGYPAARADGTGGEDGSEGVNGNGDGVRAKGSESGCEWEVLSDGRGGFMGWRKAHLFAIYPFACDLILARDPQLAASLRSLLHAVGAEMGLHPAQRI